MIRVIFFLLFAHSVSAQTLTSSIPRFAGDFGKIRGITRTELGYTFDSTAYLTGASPTITTPSITTGFTIGGVAATGTILRGNGTNFVATTNTFPNTANAGDILTATGSNVIGVVAATATANKMLLSAANATSVWSTPTIPNTSGTAGQYYRSDGTNIAWDDGAGVANITSTPSAIANTETKLLSSASSMPANRLQAGTMFHCVLGGTCTGGSSPSTPTINLRYGTAATTSDGLCEAFTLGTSPTTGTSIAFFIDFYVTIRTTGPSATAQGILRLVNQGITGLSTTATQAIAGVNTTINTTTATTFFTVSFKSGSANCSATFTTMYAEILYK